MPKSITGTTSSHRDHNSIFYFSRRNIAILKPKKNQLSPTLSQICIVRCIPERFERANIVAAKLKGVGMTITNTMFIDTKNHVSRMMHRECLILLGARNGNVPNILSPQYSSKNVNWEDLVNDMALRLDVGAERLVVFIHTNDIHEIFFHFDKEMEKKLWNNGFRYFPDSINNKDMKDIDMLEVSYKPEIFQFL